MTSESQKKASKNRRAKLKRLAIDFRPVDQDLWEQVQKQENKQEYIRKLIRKDIEGNA